MSFRFSVIEYLSNESYPNKTLAPIAYFYCARNAAEPQHANPDEIMRSILKQLSCSSSDLPIREPVSATYKERQEKAKDDGWEPEKLTVTECVELIVALRVCDPARRYELFTALDSIIQQSASLVKIFVSSRDDNDIVWQLAHSPNIFVHASDNGEDIKNFVLIEVAKSIKDKRLLSGQISEELKSRIITTLIERSQGMYVLSNFLTR